MAAQAVEYFVLLTVAGTQPEEDTEDHIVLFSWAFISKSRNQVGINTSRMPCQNVSLHIPVSSHTMSWHKLLLNILLRLLQVLTKEQLYVQPKESVPPASLPGGIKPEAVTTAASLSVVIKQVPNALSTPCVHRHYSLCRCCACCFLVRVQRASP